MNRALFLDRDGVINHDSGYTFKIDDFIFIDGIFKLCKGFSDAGYLIFVITNQAGIARGFYSEEHFLELSEWMCNEFLENGVKIQKVYYCPFHPDAVIPRYKEDSFDRKPNPGLIYKARDEFYLDLKGSVLIGDKPSDLLAGLRAGVGRNILITSDNPDAGNHYTSVREACDTEIWREL